MNTSEAELRPELLLGPNPFLEALPPAVPYARLGEKLANLPLAGIAWQLLPPAQREPLLAFSSEHYVPFRSLFDPAAGLQRLLRRSLVMMNPLIHANRVRVVRQATCNDIGRLMQCASLDGAGGIWKGMTGTCKSGLFTRLLPQLVPEQVIDHGYSEACGWAKLRQVVYLIVDHPSNGTRGGVCKRVLQMLDTVAGTDYFDQLRRTTNLDTLLVTVCHVLLIHRVALLVIDENQQKTFAESPWHLEFVLFYLLLMNLGISVLLVGNPLAFEHLHEYSQVMRRFSIGGIHAFEPAPSKDEVWWKEDFMPRMRRFSVLNGVDIAPARREEIEFEHTGGLPGLYPLLHCEAQRIALRHKDGQAILIEADFTDAAKSPSYAEAHKIAGSIRAESLQNAARFLDVPDTSVTRRGTKTAKGAPSVNEGTVAPLLVPPDPNAFEVVRRLLARYRCKQTRDTNLLLQRLQTLKSLTPKEREMLGVNEDLLKGMEEAKSATELQAAAKPKRKPRSGQTPKA